MGSCTSKKAIGQTVESITETTKPQTIDPNIHIYVRKDGEYNSYNYKLTIRKCISRLGMITVFDYCSEQMIMFEFKNDINDNDVWDYISDSVSRILKEHGVVVVSNNFMNTCMTPEFCEKTCDDMRDHIKTLVRFMKKTYSLYIKDYNTVRTLAPLSIS